MIARICTKIITLFCLLFLAGSSYAQFGPPNISGLALWLRADTLITTTAGKVSQWGDASGHNVNALPVSGQTNPTLSTAPELNSKPTIVFNGTTDGLGSTINIPGYGDSSLTIFFLVKGYNQTSGVTAGLLNVGDIFSGQWLARDMVDNSFVDYTHYNGTGGYFDLPGDLPNAGFSYKILTIQKNLNVNLKMDTNGTLAAQTTVSGFNSTFTNGPYIVGFSSGGNTLNGEIAEIIVYTKALTAVDSAKVMGYLHTKYAAPPVSLGPNVTQTTTVCPDTIRPNHTYAQYAWSTGATTPFIIPPASSTYSVTVTDAFNVTSSASVTVTLINVNLNKPVLDSVCLGSTFPFGTLISNTTPFTFLWNNGAATATINAPSSNTGASVVYQVTVSDAFGCNKASNTATLVTDTFAHTVSLTPNQTLCQGNFLSLATPSNGWSGLQFNWSQGNATTTTIPISTSGNYSVTVTDGNGCSGSSTTSVTLSGVAPGTSFTSVAAQCFGLPFSPASTTTGAVTAYLWNFGDGDTSILQSPVHTYSSTGTYTVTLKANNGGCFNTISRQLVINPKPVAAFSAPTACTNYPFTFTDLSIVTGGNTINQWKWIFGDGNTSTNQNPTHQYVATGTDAVTLIATTSNGCADTVTHNITIVNTYSASQVTALQLPVNNAAIQFPAITFKWFASANAQNYTLTISTDSTFASGNSIYANLNALQFSVSLLNNHTYYWKVTDYNICHDSSTSLVYTFSIFRPDNLPGLALWLRADTSVVHTGSTVSAWQDGSGNNVHATVASGKTAPALGTAPEFLNKPTIKFDGVNNGLASSINIPGYADSSLTVFILAKGYSQTTGNSAGLLNVGDIFSGQWLIRDMLDGSFADYSHYNGTGGNDDVIGAAPNAGFPYKIFGIQKNLGVSLKMDTNGGLALLDNTKVGLFSSFTNGPYNVGFSSGDKSLNGEIPEIIVYTKALTDPQRQLVENYLYNKYSPPVDLGPDTTQSYSFCPITLNPGSRFISYLWSTGASTSTIQATASGSYSVTVVDVFNHTSSSTVHVTLQSGISLNSTGASICAGDSVNLAPQIASFNNYSFLWSNGATTPSINVSISGNYFVQVKDTFSCSTYTDTITIVSDTFASTLSLGPDSGMCSGNSLGLFSPATGWGSLTFHWSQGNTTTSIIPISSTGHYAVTVNDANGCSGTSGININVSGLASVVSFTSSPTLCLGQIFSPQITSSTSGITFNWDFGDGFTSTSVSPSHTYSATGTYTIILRGTNSLGCTNIASAQVVVKAVPVAAFNANTACMGNSYQFADESTPPALGTLTQWQWDFGDGGTSSAQNPAYVYASPGTDPVTLTVTGSNGCTASVSHSLTVVSTYATPVAAVLQAPGNNAAIQTSLVNFKWGVSANAQNYTLTISTDPNFITGDSIYTGLTVLQYAVTLSPAQTYYWKVTAYNICGNSALSVTDTFSIFRPDNLPGLALWLRADTSVVHTGSAVSTWQDGSGNNVHATVASGQTAPTLSTAPEFLNKPTIKFDGVSNGLASSINIPGYADSSLTVFILAKGYSQTTGNSAGFLNVGNIFSGQWLVRDMLDGSFADYSHYNGTGGNDDVIGAAPNAGFPYKIFGIQKNLGVSLKMDTNGGMALLDNTKVGLYSPFTNSPYNVGFSNGDKSLNGEIPEIIVYTKALTDPQRHLVENYLYNKYSPPVDLGPDVVQNYSFCPVTLNPGTRFISYLWSTGATTSSIPVTTSGTYSVTVMDVFNRQSSSTVYVTMQNNFTLNSPDTSFCSGGSVNLAPQIASFNNYSFLWSNGATTSSINASASGNYFVKLTDTLGCFRNSDTIIVVSDNFSNTVSLGNDTGMCAGNSLGLASPSTGWGSLQFNWSTGETTSTIAIATTGPYSVTVADVNGCSGSSTVHVNIGGTAPVVSFSSVPSLCLGQTFSPQITSDTNGINFTWNFGDGDTSNLISPMHTYSSAGTYTVLLKGVNGSCANIAGTQVVVNAVPVAAFNANTACTGNSYQFADMSIPPSGGTLTQWQWAFGDGGASVVQNPSYVYASPGNDIVILTVMGNNSCTSSVSHSITVVSTYATPVAPVLQAPVNNAAIQTSLVNFKWGVSANSQSYTLTVSTDPSFITGDSTYAGLSNLQYPVTLPSAQTYYWKVIAYNICGDSAASSINSFSIFRPDNLVSLALWLRADSGVVAPGNNVNTWHDGSGNNIDATVPGTNTHPTLSIAPEFLNMPTIKFDGVGNGLASSLNIPGYGDSSLTVFILAKGYSQTTGNSAGLLNVGNIFTGQWLIRDMLNGSFADYSHYNGTGGHLDAVGAAPNAGFPYKIFGIQKTLNVDLKLDTNGGLAKFDNSTVGLYSSFTNSVYNIGFSAGDQSLNGEIPEIIVYTKALTDLQRHQVENYLYNKYSPPVDLGPDQVETYSFCPKTLDPGSRFISYLWSTLETTQTIQVTQSGTYSVTTVDVFNRTSSSTVHITLPALALNVPDTAVCLGHSILVEPQLPSFNGYNFLWSSGANTSSINVSAPGSYYVFVTDTTQNHCSLKSNTIAVFVDNFSTTVSLGPDDTLCSGNTLGLATPGPSTWSSLQFNWSTGATTSTIVTGGSDQQYLVTVTNSRGCIGNSSKHVHIAGVAPTLIFSGDTFCLGQTYDPHNTTDTITQQIVSYNWDFGDGGTGTIYDATHVYATAGTQNVTLTIANNAGCSNSLIHQVYVKQTPTAAFNTGQACIANSYQFTDLSTPPNGGSLTSWNWIFGDGNTSTLQNPANSYNTAANYTVSLTDSASNGCTNTVTGIIQVVSSTTLPPAAILEVPLNNSVWADTLVTFSWIASSGASGYSLIVSPDPTFSSNVSHFDNIDSTQFITSLPGNQAYYWRVVSYNICAQASISQTFTFTIFNPANIGGLALWLKGDDGAIDSTGAVSVWTDKSGNGVDAFQSNANYQPALVTENLMNFKPVVKFDGLNDVLTSTGLIPGIDSSSSSVFIIGNGFAQTGSFAGYLTVGPYTTGQWFLRAMAPNVQNFWMLNNNNPNGQGNGAVFDLPGTSTPNSGYPFKMFEIEKNLFVGDTGYINGSLARFSNNANLCDRMTNNPYSVGQAAGNSTLNGEIAEIIVYHTLLSPAQRRLVENYIYNKYAPPVNLGPDINKQYGLCPVVLDAQNRFVQFTWSTGDTTPTITVRKSGRYWVSTIDVFGRESSDTINVTLPYRGINPVDTSICYGKSVQVAQLLSHSFMYTYQWQNGATANPLTTGAPGLYYATITDTNGCTFISDTARVRIDSFNVIALLPADTNICNGSGLSLHNTGYPVTSYFWSPGNDTTASPAITAPGLYRVTATDMNGCLSHDSVNVTIHGAAPITDFTITNFCSNDTIKFADHSQPGTGDMINTWNWNFGDSATATGAPAQHLYGVTGQFAVTLFIKTDSGCTGAKTIYKTLYPSPVAAFTYVGSNPAIPYAICAGNYTIFTDVTPAIDSVTGRTWIIDGVTNAATQPQFQYRLPNQANDVSLKVTTNRGCTNTKTQEIDVFPALAADFKYSGACLGDTTVFTDITHSLSIISWEWQYGDSIIGLQQNEHHYYPSAGLYDVTLTIENAIGCIDHQTQLVNIVPPPVADFTGAVACKKQYYSPLDSSISAISDPITHWSWNIGGSILNGKTPQYLTGDTGALAISLTVTTQSGCKDSVSKIVEVESVPLAQFTFTPLYGSAPVDVTFSNNSTSAVSYTWDFGDGTSSIDDTPTHTYTVNGDYNIVLYAQNNFGCVDSSAKTFLVVPTDLDISVDAVSTYHENQPDGSVLVSVIVRCTNLGTRIITSAKFYASMGGVGLLEQTWTGVLPSGQIMLDTIGNFVTASGTPETYVCVTAKDVNKGETEVRYDNNEGCVSLDGTLQLVGPSPNPAISRSELGMILPKAGTVTIDIVDALGKYVIHQFNLNLPAGRSDFNIPVDMMTAAEYFIRVKYNDETQLRKLVIR